MFCFSSFLLILSFVKCIILFWLPYIFIYWADYVRKNFSPLIRWPVLLHFRLVCPHFYQFVCSRESNLWSCGKPLRCPARTAGLQRTRSRSVFLCACLPQSLVTWICWTHWAWVVPVFTEPSRALNDRRVFASRRSELENFLCCISPACDGINPSKRTHKHIKSAPLDL